jgi:hypothetical protein
MSYNRMNLFKLQKKTKKNYMKLLSVLLKKNTRKKRITLKVY